MCRELDGDKDRDEKRAKPEPVIVEAPAPLDLDADISAEEMQMMQAMGIPFGFNTTQVRTVQRLTQITCHSLIHDPGLDTAGSFALVQSSSERQMIQTFYT